MYHGRVCPALLPPEGEKSTADKADNAALQRLGSILSASSVENVLANLASDPSAPSPYRRGRESALICSLLKSVPTAPCRQTEVNRWYLVESLDAKACNKGSTAHCLLV